MEPRPDGMPDHRNEKQRRTEEQAEVEGNAAAEKLDADGVFDQRGEAVQEQPVRDADGTGDRDRVGAEHDEALRDQQLQEQPGVHADRKADEERDGHIADALPEVV